MSNRLAQSASPYLKLHAENPVDWYPWTEEAIAKAKAENKPILLSIGYTACHWCHVMAHESFEDPNTASLMNEYFINIKVDREERPDLDKVYQLSAQLLTRQVGGWPLTIFLSPDSLIPFFAGTYFPKVRTGNFPSFAEVLQYVHVVFSQKKDEIERQNISFQNIIKELEIQAKQSASQIIFTPIEKGEALLAQSFDNENGGFSKAPKFPMTPSLERLLFYGTDAAKNMLELTLKKILEGGLYDHLDGGFFRYSVDEKWQIPHFEKMLYDNALLLTLLVQAKQYAGFQFLDDYIEGTASWLLRELAAPHGGFYATLSADTDGEEGKYYVFSKDEVKNVLTPAEYEALSLSYGLNQPANFKHSWHLHIASSPQETAAKLAIGEQQLKELLEKAKTQLRQLRSHRTYPPRDEKIIASWNGLAVKALAFLGFVSQEKQYISEAQKTVDFIRVNLWHNQRLASVYMDGTLTLSATLDDYVFLIEGIFYLLQAKWRTEDFEFLLALTSVVKEQFEDLATGGFYFTPAVHEDLIYRMKQYSDEALPASNGVYTSLLQQLGYLIGSTEFLQSAEKSLKNALPVVAQRPDFYCTFLTALQFYSKPTQIIIVRGKSEEFNEWRKVALKYCAPNRFYFFIDDQQRLPNFLESKKVYDNQVVAYICEGTTCYLSALKLEDLEGELKRLTTKD